MPNKALPGQREPALIIEELKERTGKGVLITTVNKTDKTIFQGECPKKKEKAWPTYGHLSNISFVQHGRRLHFELIMLMIET
jgi:hypothetical protein